MPDLDNPLNPRGTPDYLVGQDGNGGNGESPANALQLNGETLQLNGEDLTLGA